MENRAIPRIVISDMTGKHSNVQRESRSIDKQGMEQNPGVRRAGISMKLTHVTEESLPTDMRVHCQAVRCLPQFSFANVQNPMCLFKSHCFDSNIWFAKNHNQTNMFCICEPRVAHQTMHTPAT